MKKKNLVDKKVVLEKIAEKGGWTFCRIPEIKQDKKNPFGWVRVKGSIDDYSISAYHLMPLGNGQLFLPVKAEIRKKIKKKEGDYVHVVLDLDQSPIELPEELKICLQEEPKAYHRFNKLSDGEQKQIIGSIYSAKKEETKIIRIVKLIEQLLNKK